MSSSTPQTFPVAAEGAEFNPSNIFKFIAAVSPIILTWFLAAASIFNQDIKGIIGLAGILIAICINVLLSNMIKSKPFPERNAVCEIFNLPFASNYNSPSVNSMIIAFTAAYLIAPMRENDQMNYGLVAIFSCNISNRWCNQGNKLLYTNSWCNFRHSIRIHVRIYVVCSI